MQRTKLKDRVFPNYTKGEEIFNSVSHIVGGGIGVIALVSCIIVAVIKGNTLSVISGSIYGASLIVLYCFSSIYHALNKNTGKKVLQILDHCAIFFLIAGTYTPIALGPIIKRSPVCAIIIMAVVWISAILGITFNAIDLKKYEKFSFVCYLLMGWCIVATGKVAVRAIGINGFMWLLAGGIAYTLGALLYLLGIKHKYMHSVFHIFVVIGSFLQYIAIIFYCI